MTDKFILWAQALDNTSSDHFYVYGKDLASDDTAQRQEAAAKVSSVIKSGSRLFEKGNVQLTANTSHFVIEVPSVQRDNSGRAAPIVCYGDYDATVGNALGASAAIALDEFAKKIGRTLYPEYSELIQASFDILKKKSLATKLMRLMGLWTIVLVLLVIAYWLA